jgi:hypothetical protein
MPSSVFFGMQHLNNNLICALGFDATAADPDVGEIVELACVPINHMLQVHTELPLFNMKMKPNRLEEIDWSYCRVTKPEMAQLCNSGFDRDKVADYFVDWFRAMNMPRFKKVIPLAHNYPELRGLLISWLGWDNYHEVFHDHYRDTMILAHCINDAYDVRGNVVPFSKQNLRWLGRQLDVENYEKGGSPCMDANTTMEVYKRLLKSLP